MVNQAVGTRPSADRNEVKQIVDDMMVQVGHVGIQQEGCKTIIELAKASHSLIDRIEGLIAVGAHFAIMNAMLAHSKDVKMQRLGCQAVGSVGRTVRSAPLRRTSFGWRPPICHGGHVNTSR